MNSRTAVAAVTSFLAFTTCLRADSYKADSGPSTVEQRDEIWHDGARKRDIPIRLYLPADARSPSPVILVSHGLGGTRDAMAYVASHWSSHGYVVIALQHAGSDDAVWRDAETPRERMAAMRDAANYANAVLRCDDVHFAIDHLERLAAPGGALAGIVDLAKIGMVGHSFGAQTTQSIIGQRPGTERLTLPSRRDDRVKAAVAFSPGYQREDAEWAFADVRVPCFHFTGTRDSVGVVSSMTPEQRRVPFDHVHARGQRLITFEGGDHMVFSGRTPAQADAALYDRVHDLIRQTTTAFWDAELKGDASARTWMDEKMSGAVGASGKVEVHD